MRNIITIKESVFVAMPQAAVWDFTQDYAQRHLWDKLIKSAVVIQEEPRTINIKSMDGSTMTIVYKSEKRPYKTSLAIVEINSPIIESGGGSWQYTFEPGGTIWTQVNTIVLKDNFFCRLLTPFVTMLFQWATRTSMEKAKQLLEQQ